MSLKTLLKSSYRHTSLGNSLIAILANNPVTYMRGRSGFIIDESCLDPTPTSDS